MKRQVVALAVAVVLSISGHSAWGETRYTLTDLGTLPGGSQWSCSEATGINASGQVVGTSWSDKTNTHAFIWNNGTMTDLGAIGTGFSAAKAINANGRVVGSFSTGAGTRAFLYENQTMTSLGALPGGTHSVACDINATGDIVGYSNAADNVWHAVLWSHGTMTDLGLGWNGQTFAINDTRQMAYTDYQAALWNDGTTTHLGKLLGTDWSTAADINARGQVVGHCTSYPGPGWIVETAFLYSNGTMSELGTLGGQNTRAHGINASGYVVGSADVPDTWGHAFFYDGTMHDLNTLVDPALEWILRDATAINDSGWIVGNGYTPTGEAHAFLLTPTPEPSSIVLLGTGAIGLFSYACRRRRQAV